MFIVINLSCSNQPKRVYLIQFLTSFSVSLFTLLFKVDAFHFFSSIFSAELQKKAKGIATFRSQFFFFLPFLVFLALLIFWPFDPWRVGLANKWAEVARPIFVHDLNGAGQNGLGYPVSQLNSNIFNQP